MRQMAAAALVILFGCKQGRPASQHEGPANGGSDGGDATSDGGSATLKDARWPPPRPGYLNPIPAENQKVGDPGWRTEHVRPPFGSHRLEGYADRVSALAGEPVNVMVRSDSAQGATWTLYRLGWYGGAGARPLASGTTRVGAQPGCADDKASGLVRCGWAPSFTVPIPRDAVSGLFLVRVVRDDKLGILVPLVVRGQRPADLYFQSSVTTAQAYNNWGGEGLYTDSHDGIAGGFALAVSFDRPYESDNGSGQVLRYEASMARWLERHGYDVSYTTNLDVAREGVSALSRRGAFLSVGHDEYWPGEEREAVEAARDQGVPVYFFGGNPAYWKVRLSSPGADGNARVITCYKRYPQRDPLAGTPDQTGRYRDAPINRPEEALAGTMYESWMLFGQPWTVMNSAAPAYEGTGLRDFDTIPQLVGYEYDRVYDGGTPAPVTVLAHSAVVDAEGLPGSSDAVTYTAPGGALVFAAGTIYWSQALDGAQRDARVERITANLLHLGLGLPVPEALASVTPPPAAAPDPAWATDVTTFATGMAGPAGVAQLPDGSFVVADARANRIWRVDAGGGVTPFAGDGVGSWYPRFDNVPALQARFFHPTAVLADSAGRVYVSDTQNCVIRRVGNDPARTVSTVAGVLYDCGFADGTGSGARFNRPMGLAWLDASHIAIADAHNHAVRVLDTATGAVSTLAVTHGGDEQDGARARATFYYPTAVAVAPDGRVFVLASSTGKLKVISADPSRTLTTLVGGGLGYADGPGDVARLQPQGGLLWLGGSLLVSEPGSERIRIVEPGTSAATTRVRTWAGSGRMGPADGPAQSAAFALPLGMTRGADGNVYLVDAAAGSLRRIRP